MPGLVPGIHVLTVRRRVSVDGRLEPGHDEWLESWSLMQVPFVSEKENALALSPRRYDISGHEAVMDLLRRCHLRAERRKRLRAGHPARQLAISAAATSAAAPAEDRGAGDPQDGRIA